MQKGLQMGRKHCEKEKLLISSNFSFSHSVFKRLILQTQKKRACFTLHNKGEGVYCNRHAVHLSVRGHNFVWSFSPTVLHVLLWNLYIMFVYIWSCACAIFMTILSLVVELSSLELVNFTELLLSREIILKYCMYWTQLHAMLLVLYSSACAIFITILSLVGEFFPLELVNFA